MLIFVSTTEKKIFACECVMLKPRSLEGYSQQTLQICV